MSVQRSDSQSERPVSVPRSAAAGARGDPGGGCWCSTMVLPSPTGEVIVLRVAGEVDLSSVAVLRAALSAVLAHRADHVVVDLVELRFCSVRGLAVLAEAGVTAAGQGTEYAVGGASRQAGRVWALGWAANELPIRFRTAGDGVLAALAHQAGRADRVSHRAGWTPKHLHRAGPPVPGRPVDTTPAPCAG